MNILVATIHPWNIKNYKTWKVPKGFSKHLITKKEDLHETGLKSLNPKFIFFPHWSYLIAEEIYKNYTCVVFHMTDLPFGRGGSPLQNLIVSGVKTTKITALLVNGSLDGGDYYLKKALDISDGSAEVIYNKASKIIFEMINDILIKKPELKKQRGKITIFKRRTPAQSKIPTRLGYSKIFDFIRMLDAQGYPHAFLETKNARFEFTDAEISKFKITAKISVLKKNQ